jgi:GTP-binding protein
LERSHVAIVLFDATEPAVEQDSRLVGLCVEKTKPLILAVNKADLVKGKAARKAVEEALDEHLPFLPGGTPIIFVSARHGTGMDEVLPLAGRLYDQAGHRVGTPEINRFLRDAEEAHPAPRAGRYPVRLYYMTQVAIRPPTFLIHVNRPEGITEGYKRFLTARMREKWDLRVPVRLVFRKRRR